MSNSLLTDALQEAYASCNDSLDIFETIMIDINPKLCYCSGLKKRTTLLEDGTTSVVWTPAPFKIQFPKQSADGYSAMTISIGNIDGLAIKTINLIKAKTTPTYLYYRTYIETYPAPQNPRPIKLELSSATATLSTVSFQATVPDIVNQRFPHGIYSYSVFPGLRS